MNTSYFSKFNEKIRERVLQHSSEYVFWDENSPDYPRSFVELVEWFSDKPSSALKRSAVVLYPVHAVLLNFNDSYKRWLVQNGYSLVAFLPLESAPE